jgi:hypothetical protein
MEVAEAILSAHEETVSTEHVPLVTEDRATCWGSTASVRPSRSAPLLHYHHLRLRPATRQGLPQTLISLGASYTNPRDSMEGKHTPSLLSAI